MKRIISGCFNYRCLFFCILIVSSGCSSYYATIYSNTEIRLGESKESIIEKYGQPYSEDLLSDNNEPTEIFCYKETMAYGYILKTYFYFQNNRLIKKIQKEENPTNVILKEKH